MKRKDSEQLVFGFLDGFFVFCLTSNRYFCHKRSNTQQVTILATQEFQSVPKGQSQFPEQPKPLRLKLWLHIGKVMDPYLVKVCTDCSIMRNAKLLVLVYDTMMVITLSY